MVDVKTIAAFVLGAQLGAIEIGRSEDLHLTHNTQCTTVLLQFTTRAINLGIFSEMLSGMLGC